MVLKCCKGPIIIIKTSIYLRGTNFCWYYFSRISRISRFLPNLIGQKQRIALKTFTGKVIREN